MKHAGNDLEERLRELNQKEMVELVSKLYRMYPEIRREIDLAVVKQDDFSMMMENITNFTAGESKEALLAHAKTIKNKRERVLCYFTYVEKVLDEKDTLDARYIQVASAVYGKAMDILAKHKDLWDEMLEKSFEIAKRFNEMGSQAGDQAVIYYMRAKHGFDPA